MLVPCSRGGGGGATSICMHIGYVPQTRPPIFSHEFPFRSISFSQITKTSVPEHHHFTSFGGFCRSGDHHFQNFFNFNPFIASHGRGSARSAAPRVSGRSGDSHFKRSAVPQVSGRSGAPHFHAQNSSSSFRSPAVSSSKRLKLVPEPHIFTLDRELVPEHLPIFTLPRHIPTKIWCEYPPPPPGPCSYHFIILRRLYIICNRARRHV